MARKPGKGPGLVRPSRVSRKAAFGGPAGVQDNHARWLALLMCASCALLLLFAPSAWAQDGTIDQNVHITPHGPKAPQPGDPKPGGDVDPSLKTHTKPLVKDVDLVLVHVTITDPMNRLVTDLEKNNFTVSNG